MITDRGTDLLSFVSNIRLDYMSHCHNISVQLCAGVTHSDLLPSTVCPVPLSKPRHDLSKICPKKCGLAQMNSFSGHLIWATSIVHVSNVSCVLVSIGLCVTLLCRGDSI